MTTFPNPPLPARPYFSSGPCAKPPGWAPEKLFLEDLGRSHRGTLGKQRLRQCIDLMREMLELPDTHRIGIVPGSDTEAYDEGAVSVTPLTLDLFAAQHEGIASGIAAELNGARTG